MNRRTKVVLSLVVVAVLLLSSLPICFLLGRASTEREWSRKVQPHTPEEMRGLVNAMTKFVSEPPNFLPLSAFDDEVCAASITNAVNFILGEERLISAPAWLFSKVNAEKLKFVYDRSQDFEIVDGRIIENKDRGFSLTKLLDPSGIYILGYHYRETRSDAKIISANADLNSHLMLLLGKKDGTWQGYHLIHYPSETLENPVKVEPLTKMPELLDLVYIWQVKDVVLPPEGKNLFLANTNLPYSRLAGWLNWGPHSLEYVVDTASMWLVTFFTKTSQFPNIIDLGNQEVVELKHYSKPTYGTVMGFYKGVPIYHNGKDDVKIRGTYGIEFQCVELVNRFLVSLGHQNLTKTGEADSYFWDAELKGLRKFPQGSAEAPRPDDILVFDLSDHDGQPGHVAVIYEVTDEYLCFVQQNFGRVWRDCLPLRYENNGWQVILPKKLEGYYPPVAGWSRVASVQGAKTAKRGAR